MILDLSPLKDSVNALERAINAVEHNKEILKEDILEAARAGVIQNFEVTYELCWKFIQRWFKENRSPDEAESIRTKKDIFRMAARENLITDPLPWFSYAEARNLSAHTYNSKNADYIYGAAGRFLFDAKKLLSALEQVND